MRRTHEAALSAVALVTPLWLVGCAPDPPSAAPPPSLQVSPETSVTTAPTIAPLPPVDQLTGVLYRLADTTVPAEQKIALVQYATADDQAALTNFGEALEASGFHPLTVAARDLIWAGEPGHVVAAVTMGSGNPTVKPFTFPMEFTPLRDQWQLSQRTADQLLPLVGAAPKPPR